MEHDPRELYIIACELALCIPIVRDETRKQDLAAEAVQVLKKAVAAGWSDAKVTQGEAALQPLGDRDDFRRLVVELFDRGFPANPFIQ